MFDSLWSSFSSSNVGKRALCFAIRWKRPHLFLVPRPFWVCHGTRWLCSRQEGTIILFKIPHKPPTGSLKVLHAPARRGGIRRASQTKINNLETDEFVSNPPFSKIWPTSWREEWLAFLKKSILTFYFLNYLSNLNHSVQSLFFEK